MFLIKPKVWLLLIKIWTGISTSSYLFSKFLALTLPVQLTLGRFTNRTQMYFCLLHIQWGSEIHPIKIRTFWRSDFKWPGFSYGYSYSPNHSKTGPSKIRMFLMGFQMVFFYKMEAIYSGFQTVGLPIQNLQPHLFLTVWKQTCLDFRSPLY